MSATLPRHITALISLLVFLLAAQTSVQGYVWCIGEDGHSAFESAQNSACTERSNPTSGCHSGEAHCLSHSDEHCGPCLDLRLSLDASSGRDRSLALSLHDPTLPAAARLELPPLVQVRNGDPLPAFTPFVRPTLLFQRTIVLLI